MNASGNGARRVQFDHVSLTFDTSKGPLSVVEDVTYDINDGDFVAVIGPSGCGKTTMMSMLAGFRTPTTGRVLFDGKPVKGPGPERGVIFQEYGVFPWLTVKQNIAFGLQLKANHVAAAEREQICEHYLALMGLSDFANSYPKHLSGGMRQRLAIARAYAVKPQFLLMDEPFGALDAQTRANMQNLLLRVLASRGQDGHADHAFGRGSDLSRFPHRGGDGAPGADQRDHRRALRLSARRIAPGKSGVRRIAQPHPRARDERIPRAAGTDAARGIFGIIKEVRRRE